MTLRVAVKDLSVLRRKGGMSFELRAPVLNVFAGQSLAVLGASGLAQSASSSASFFTPRGHSRSIRMRAPSSGAGAS